ncbi:UTP--glucose-1-phosphate uridylyltransferase, partial [Bacillus haynesii]|nr:UTP--glucose-1-phosphate uridylyltransferase [Bacillus haynesii]
EGKLYVVCEKHGFITTTLEFSMQDKELREQLVPFMEGLLNKEEI